MWIAALACHREVPLDPPEVLDLCATCEASCAEEVLEIESSDHVSGGVDYADPPPVGGDHDPCWATWGVHDEEVPDERWVHNLEHGGIVLLYACADCPDEVAALAGLVEERGVHGLLTPYAQLPRRFAAVAWGVRYVTDCFDLDAIEAFWDANVDRAPESVTADPGTSCEM